MKLRTKIALILCPILFIGGVLTSPNLHEYGYKLTKSRAQIMAIHSAIELFRDKYGRFPSKAEGIKILATKPESKTIKAWEPVLPWIRKDPWGNEYQYLVDAEKVTFQVSSFGPNGLDDAEKLDDIHLKKSSYDCELFNDCRSLIHQLSSVMLLLSLVIILYLVILGVFFLNKLIFKNIKDNKTLKNDADKSGAF